MEKPPSGKHSTKGIGKNKPLETEFETWNDVTVPCGHPVASAVSDTSLLYNEYIVYDTNQVSWFFMYQYVDVRFLCPLLTTFCQIDCLGVSSVLAESEVQVQGTSLKKEAN
jgi:hypothetical protein